MKKDTRTIVNKNTKENIENNIENEIIDDNITFQVINLHTAEEYKEKPRKESFEIIVREPNKKYSFKRIMYCSSLLLLLSFIAIFCNFYFSNKSSNNTTLIDYDNHLENYTNESYNYLLNSETYSFTSSTLISYSFTSTLISYSSTIIQSQSISISPSESFTSTQTLSNTQSISLSKSLTPSQIPTQTSSNSQSISISKSLTPSQTTYLYYVRNSLICITYTNRWCHNSCTHSPSVCPSCCIHI